MKANSRKQQTPQYNRSRRQLNVSASLYGIEEEDSLNNTHAKTGVSFNGWAVVKSHNTNVSPIHDLTSDLWSQQDLIICDTG